jgi:plasmid stabilization system protein ParE
MTFAVLFRSRAARELEEIRAWLGLASAVRFDDALAQALVRLEAHPHIGPPALLRGRWSRSVRNLIVGETGYRLFYRVNVQARVVEVLSIWHERRRPPRL